MFESILSFFKKKQNINVDDLKKKIEEQNMGLLVRIQALEEQSVACLQLLHEEIKARQNINKSIKAAVEVIMKHTTDLKSLYELSNDHADVINGNMKVLNTHLTEDHDIKLNNRADTIHDVLKNLNKKNTKKDSGNN